MECHTFTHTLRSGWSEALPESDPSEQLVVVFGAPEYSGTSEPFVELASRYPNAQIVGCSSAGEIFQDQILDKSLSIATCRFAKATVKTAFSLLDEPKNSFLVGKQLADELNSPNLVGVVVLSNGLHVNGSNLVKGLKKGLPGHVKITGGLAGDGARFEKTWVLHGEQLNESGVVAIGFYGDTVCFGYGSKGGWDIFGPERTITHAEGNVVYEIDNKPALQLYKEYLGDEAQGLPATGLLFPLAIRSEDDSKKLVRTLLAVDEAHNTLTFAGDVYEGWRAQLMQANLDRLIDGAAGAGSAAQEIGRHEGDTLALAISCVGRRLILRDRSEEEVEATLESLPAGTQQIGFYSYGEISPSGLIDCDLHNQTMTITTISESDSHG